MPPSGCENYKAILRSDGTATYIGHPANNGRKGEFKGKIDFAPIAAMVESKDFFALEDLYGVDVTHPAVVNMSVTRGGVTKQVRTRNFPEPVPLLEITNEIEIALSRIKWKRIRR